VKRFMYSGHTPVKQASGPQAASRAQAACRSIGTYIGTCIGTGWCLMCECC
jgi:hypothetical protein